jgi:hypothetical protein
MSKMVVKRNGANTARTKNVKQRGVGKLTRKPSPSGTHVRGGAIYSPRGSKGPMDAR